jgi:hypothetical protein
MTAQSGQVRPPQDPKPSTRAVRSALWSIYHHCFHIRSLKRSVLNVLPAIEPVPLAQAIQVIIGATDPQRVARQRRVIRRLAAAGLTNRQRWQELTEAAFSDSEWKERVREAQARVWSLAESLHLKVAQLQEVPIHRAVAYLEGAFAIMDPTCTTTNATLEACQLPNYKGFGHPLTTVTASADISQTPRVLARMFDPRSWGTCFDHFDTWRVDDLPAYPPHSPDTDPIGLPWDPVSRPHLIHEIVIVSDGTDDNIFDNVLKITNFEVSDTHARLDFELWESRHLVIPTLAVSQITGINVDSGYLEANLIASPDGNPLSHVTMVKSVQFANIAPGASAPFGVEPGEMLNYLAPSALCMWLEDLTQGAVCCSGLPPA